MNGEKGLCRIWLLFCRSGKLLISPKAITEPFSSSVKCFIQIRILVTFFDHCHLSFWPVTDESARNEACAYCVFVLDIHTNSFFIDEPKSANKEHFNNDKMKFVFPFPFRRIWNCYITNVSHTRSCFSEERTLLPHSVRLYAQVCVCLCVCVYITRSLFVFDLPLNGKFNKSYKKKPLGGKVC